jgi:hypothetical protein
MMTLIIKFPAMERTLKVLFFYRIRVRLERIGFVRLEKCLINDNTVRNIYSSLILLEE